MPHKGAALTADGQRQKQKQRQRQRCFKYIKYVCVYVNKPSVDTYLLQAHTKLSFKALHQRLHSASVPSSHLTAFVAAICSALFRSFTLTVASGNDACHKATEYKCAQHCNKHTHIHTKKQKKQILK